MKMDLNLFRVFDVIYSERNLTRAAEVLNLTQPAVSHALSRLRDQFEDPLFVRQGNKMQPTAVSKNVIADVREALHKLQVSLQQYRHFNPAQSRKQFSVSLPDLLEASYLPLIASVLEKQAPAIELTSVKLFRREMETKLAAGELDFAIDVLLPVSKAVKHRPIRQDNLVMIMRREHPLLSCSNNPSLEVTQETYLRQRHILVSSRSSGLGLEDFELGRIGLQRKVGIRCQHFFTACRIVENSNMILTMPEAPAKMLNKGLANSVLPLPVDLPSLDVHLYWHNSVDSDPANLWLRQVILEIAKNSNKT